MIDPLMNRLENLGQPRVLVVGDLILDRYIWGYAERISQEAPVALLRADHREHRLGGASSVATMLAALGAKVCLVGVVGQDESAILVRQILTDQGIDDSLVLSVGDRPTTVGVGAHRLRQAHDVRRLEGEAGARHLDDLGEPAHPRLGQLLRRAAHFIATDGAPGHDRDQAMQRRYLHVDRHACPLHYRASNSATIGAVDVRLPIFHRR